VTLDGTFGGRADPGILHVREIILLAEVPFLVHLTGKHHAHIVRQLGPQLAEHTAVLLRQSAGAHRLGGKLL